MLDRSEVEGGGDGELLCGWICLGCEQMGKCG